MFLNGWALMRPLLVPLALCGALALAACGVKGPLEPPPGAQVAAPPATATPPAPKPGTKPDPTTYVPPRTAAELYDSATPHADWEKQKKPAAGTTGSQQLLQGVNRPNQPFVLDGLL